MYIKYTYEQFAKGMVDKGQVRVSTFWHFQADERKEIGDPEEGHAAVLFVNDTDENWVLTADMLDVAAGSPDGHPRHTKSKTVAPGFESWIEAVGGFNTYMFSLTQAEAPSRALMERLGYDAAVEIGEIDGFAAQLGEAMRQVGERQWAFSDKGVSRVRVSHNVVNYVATKRRRITPSTLDRLCRDEIGVDELFTKLEAFSYQQEYRIAFFFVNPETDKTISLDLTLDPAPEPVIIHDDGLPRIGNSLRLVQPDEFED